MPVTKTKLEDDISGACVQHYFASAASDEIIIDGSSFAKRGRHIKGASFQASVGVSLYFTLSPADDARNTNPSVQSGIQWTAATVLSANVITTPGFTFTAVKVVFAGAGALHIALE